MMRRKERKRVEGEGERAERDERICAKRTWEDAGLELTVGPNERRKRHDPTHLDQREQRLFLHPLSSFLPRVLDVPLRHGPAPP